MLEALKTLLLAQILPTLLEFFVVPVFIGVTGGALSYVMAWLATHVPGPLRDMLLSKLSAADQAAMLAAMERKAVDLVREGKLTSFDAARDLLHGYVKDNLPGRLRRLAPSPEAISAFATQATISGLQKALSAGLPIPTIDLTPAVPTIPPPPGG